MTKKDSTAIAKLDPLVKVGKREVSLVGWTVPAVEQHLFEHRIHTTWCVVACLARTFFSRATEANIRAVRRRLPGLARTLILRKQFLVIDYAKLGHGEALRVKLFQGTTPEERAATMVQLERMRKRRVFDETKYATALAIVESGSTESTPTPAAPAAPPEATA